MGYKTLSATVGLPCGHNKRNEQRTEHQYFFFVVELALVFKVQSKVQIYLSMCVYILLCGRRVHANSLWGGMPLALWPGLARLLLVLMLVLDRLLLKSCMSSDYVSGGS